MCMLVITPDRRQSKTLILSTNVDQKSLETDYRLPFVATRATNGNLDWRQMAIESIVSNDF